MSYQVLIADDFRMSRTVFEQAIAMSHSFTLAASVDSAEKALKYLECNPADLVIIDIVMTEGKSGLGTGGIVTKLNAAEIVNRYDSAMLLVNSRKEDILGRLARGEEKATVFVRETER